MHALRNSHGRSWHLFGVLLTTMLFGLSSPAQAEVTACIPTESDAMGPFYVSGTPVVEDLNRFGKSGEPLKIEGMIRSSAGDHPGLPGATVEIWQTDGEGDYYPDDNGQYADYSDDAIDLRGTVVADDLGQFDVMSVIPGAYFPRPRHFHYRVSAEGHKTLVTQHYITGDGLLSQPGGDCRHAAIEENNGIAHFRAPDIFLEPE